MIDVRRWLACGTCGARGDGGNVCPGCGATRGARVPLDRAGGDGRWLVALRGPRDAVLAELAPDGAADQDQLDRLAAARRVLEGLGPGAVGVWLDLRPAAAGAVARKGPSPAGGETTAFVLPWLLVRAEGGREARIVRRAQSRPRRGQPPAAFALDELALRGPGGALRRPLRGPGRLDRVDWSALDAGAPPPGPLPATAPADPQTAARAPVASGLALGLLLLVAAPLALGALVPDGPAARERRAAGRLLRALAAGVDPDAVASLDTALAPAAARGLIRAAAAHPSPHARRNALAAAAAHLDPAERRRRWASAARGDPSPEVARVAVGLLAREGPVGAVHLAEVVRSAIVAGEVRAQALLDLVDVDPARAGAEALQLLRMGTADGDVRAAAFGALAAPGAVADPLGARRQLSLALGTAAPLERAAAGWALASVAPVDTGAREDVLEGLAVTLDDAVDPEAPWRVDEVARAQEVLAGALVRCGAPAGWLRAARAHPGLASPAARRVLDAAVAADAAALNSETSGGR